LLLVFLLVTIKSRVKKDWYFSFTNRGNKNMALNNTQRDVLRELLSSQIETVRDAVKNDYELAIKYLELAISEKTTATFELTIDKLDQTVKDCLQKIHEIYTGKLSINALEPFATQVRNSSSSSSSSSSSNSSPQQLRLTDISVQSGLLQDIKKEVTDYVGQHIQRLRNYKKFDEKTGNAFAHITDSNSRKLIIEAIHDLITEEIKFAKKRIENGASLRENRLEIELRKIEAKVRNKLEPLSDDLTSLTLQQDSRDDDYMKMFVEQANNICSMMNDIGTLKTNVAELKIDVSTLKTDVAEIKIDVSTLKTDVAEIKIDVSTLKTDVAKINKALETLVQEQSRQSDTLQKQQESINKLLEGQARQQQSLETLMQGQARQQQSLETLIQGQASILSFLQQGAVIKKLKNDGSSSSTSSSDSSPKFFSPNSTH
jgi:chromosome segregation ATPase